MEPAEIEAFVAEYLRYLRWNRLPAITLTDRGEVDRVMSEWLAHCAENPHTDPPDDMFSLIHDDPTLAWQLLRRVSEESDEADLDNLGAGDLETFVHVQAVPFVLEIETAIRQSAKVRLCIFGSPVRAGEL